MASIKTPKNIAKIGIPAIIILVIASLFEIDLSQLTNSGTNPLVSKKEESIPAYYKVVRIIDGDTFVLSINGTDEKVRLIGINTPETVDPRKQVECFGKEASGRLKELLNGENVRLEYDDSQGMRDTYGRLLAYVYLEDGQMINRKMIAEGYAYEYTYLTPYGYQKEFRNLQTLARVSSRGLWNADTCAGSK